MEKDTTWALVEKGRVLACMTDWVREHDAATFKREMRGWVKEVAKGNGAEIKELATETIRAMPFGREKQPASVEARHA